MSKIVVDHLIISSFFTLLFRKTLKSLSSASNNLLIKPMANLNQNDRFVPLLEFLKPGVYYQNLKYVDLAIM